MRVAVVDSGVNPAHPHISGVAGGVSIDATGVVVPGVCLDQLGHGTAVMAAIQEKAAGAAAEYFAVKVFHDSLRTSARCLLRALEWALDEQMDVVNLSLGTTNPAHAVHFAPLVARAVAEGVTLVSALPQYPGCMEGVVGVVLDPDCPRDEYRVVEAGYAASGYPRPAPGIPVERNLQGISFAVANVTGFLIRDWLSAVPAPGPANRPG